MRDVTNEDLDMIADRSRVCTNNTKIFKRQRRCPDAAASMTCADSKRTDGCSSRTTGRDLRRLRRHTRTHNYARAHTNSPTLAPPSPRERLASSARGIHEARARSHTACRHTTSSLPCRNEAHLLSDSLGISLRSRSTGSPQTRPKYSAHAYIHALPRLLLRHLRHLRHRPPAPPAA